jgi:predicted kinase
MYKGGKMATLHLMIGLPGSGKTTRAKELEKELGALRLTPDEWHLHLFGHDVDEEAHDERHMKVEQIMWTVAARVLALGTDVILDFGCWAREEREDFRARAHALGADFRLHYMEVSIDELKRRLGARNQSVGDQHVFFISDDNIRQWAALFQPPDADELTRR